MGLPRYVQNIWEETIETVYYAYRQGAKDTIDNIFDMRAGAVIRTDPKLKDGLSEKWRSYKKKLQWVLKKQYMLANSVHEGPYDPEELQVRLAKSVGLSLDGKIIYYRHYDTVLYRYSDSLPKSYRLITEVGVHCRNILLNPSLVEQEKRALMIGAKRETQLKERVAKRKQYKSRNFPAILRAAIIKRDGYRCQICGTHRDQLPESEKLEIDHIIEYHKGGPTSYENGQTVCSSCNKGKHHAIKNGLNKSA